MEVIDKRPTFGIALIQLKVTEDKTKNLQRAEQMIRTAVELYNPSILVLPEFFNTPYGAKTYKDYSEDIENSETVILLKSLAKEIGIYIIGGSIPIWTDSSKTLVYNTCFCIDKSGEVKTIYKKNHLFDINIPGKIVYQESLKIAPGDSYGIFETEYGKIGIGICYDIRFAEYSLALRKVHNVDMLIYPAAFNTITGPMHWELLARSRAVDNQVYVAMCSPSRDYENPNAYQAYGHSIIVDPYGSIVTTTGHEECIVYSKIDFNKNKEISEQIPIWKQKREDLYELVSKK